jgi:hypothetical protein
MSAQSQSLESGPETISNQPSKYFLSHHLNHLHDLVRIIVIPPLLLVSRMVLAEEIERALRQPSLRARRYSLLQALSLTGCRLRSHRTAPFLPQQKKNVPFTSNRSSFRLAACLVCMMALIHQEARANLILESPLFPN